ncbi:MAG: hypothetical protein K2P81_15165 [Bacteriovoracaceae bacterium]|nr:hypothetical protein [Bacteriovoracaceae bacterium]
MATDGKKVLYLGDDSAYFKVIAAEFQRLYPEIKLEPFSGSSPDTIQGLILKVRLLKPALVFVDFSKNTDDYIHLARLLVRTNSNKPCPVIGLHDFLSPAEQLKEGYLTGVPLNYIKSGEVFDVVFGAVNLISPGQAKEHGFATAKMTEEITPSHLCKIGFIHGKGLHFESAINFSQGEELRIKHHWIQKKLIPSTLVKVKKTSGSLLYYSKYAIDVDFGWVDPVITSDTDTQERIDELKGEREHSVTKAKKALEGWLTDNQDRSQAKSIRVLVVDRLLSFYQDLPRTDKYGYSLRIQPFIQDLSKEIDALQPQVIAFALDLPPEKGAAPLEAPMNDMDMLNKIIQILTNKFTELSPYIVVFNAPSSSKELQESLKYPQLMAYDGPLSPEVLLKMASLFEKKIQISTDTITTATGNKVFVKKSSPMSIGDIEQVISITQISETDAVFTCERDLPEGSTLRIETPFVGYFTVATHPQLSKPPAYYALINGIGETEKKSLRRYVNAIFFKDHDAAKLAEMESFQNLNKAKWQEMIDKQKLELEKAEADKKKAEIEKEKAEEEKLQAAQKTEEPQAPAEEKKED